MVRSSHHLPLPSLPPPRVVLCSPFSPYSPPSPPLPAGKFEGARAPAPRYRRIASIARTRTRRESLPICKRVADGHHHHRRHHRSFPLSQPIHPHARYVSTISEDRYLACRPHFFGSLNRPGVLFPTCSLSPFGFSPLAIAAEPRSLATFQLRIRYRHASSRCLSQFRELSCKNFARMHSDSRSRFSNL